MGYEIKRHAARLSNQVCAGKGLSRRGGAARALIVLLGLAGLLLTGMGMLMPVSWKALDPVVLRESARGTPSFAEALGQWETAGKPGTAHLFRLAWGRIHPETDLPTPPGKSAVEAAWRPWGGPDPFLERIFTDGLPRIGVTQPTVIPLFVPPDSRRQLDAFLRHSNHRAVQAVLANRRVEHADRFMPAPSSSGQPLEATLYLTALLLQGDHFAPSLADRITRLAEEAARENRLGRELETIYLDLFALGVRLSWQALADLAPMLDSPSVLRRVAHLAQLLEADWPLFYAAALWTRTPAELSIFLVRQGKDGLDALKEAMRTGQGAVATLARQAKPLRAPGWRERMPFPALMADLAWRAPEVASAVKVGSLFGGMLAVFLGFNLYFQTGSSSRILRRSFGLTLLQSMLIAAAFTLAAFILSEPFVSEAGHKSEFRLQLPFTLAPSSGSVPLEESFTIAMDQITLFALSIFFVLQMIIYVICWIKIFEIRRQPVASRLKLRLLENEENLFDAGLYVGLGGTIVALILLAVGVIEDAALMAAYASTLFGIVFVALFKICHLRPYRRRLIVESQAYEA